MKKKPCNRVTKRSACEMMATWRYMIMCSCGSLWFFGAKVSSWTLNLSSKKLVSRTIITNATLYV